MPMRSYLCLLLALAAGTAVAADKPATIESFLQRLGYFPIPLFHQDNHLYVDGELNGAKARFFVDSGWSLSAVDEARADKLPRVGEGVAGVKDSFLGELTGTNWHLVQRLEIAGAQFLNQPVRLRRLASRTGKIPASAVLGCDFLFRNFALIDFQERRLFVRGSGPPSAHRQALEESLRRSGFGRAELTVSPALAFTAAGRIGDEQVPLVVDTGGVWSILDKEVARRLGLKLHPSHYKIGGVAARRMESLSVARLETFGLGGTTLKEFEFGVADLAQWRLGEGRGDEAEVAAGVLGADFLAYHRALLDFHGKAMWFLPEADDRRPRR